MKEVDDDRVSNRQDTDTEYTDPDPVMIGWADIPHRALIADHGSVLSDEVLLRLFCDALSIKQEQQQSLIETIIVRFGSLAAVFSANDRALSGLVHIGLPMRVALRIVHEAAIRVSRARLDHENIFNNRKFMFDYLISRLAREPIEQFRILFLDEKNRLLADETQSRGTVNHTPVYPREVARRAMELGAKSVILVHNHPSGDPTPSRDDIVMTHDMQKAMGLIAVSVADHIIVGNGNYVSFEESGLLKIL